MAPRKKKEVTQEQQVTLSEKERYNLYNDNIKRSVDNMANSFVEIGCNLLAITQDKLYEYSGYENIYDYAKKKFSIARGTCNNFINVAKRFCEMEQIVEESQVVIDAHLKPEFKKYSSSQLIVMLGLEEEKLTKVSPDMTVRDMKQAVKDLQEYEPMYSPLTQEVLNDVQQQVDLNQVEEVLLPSATLPKKDMSKIASDPEGYKSYKYNSMSEYQANIDDIDDLITYLLQSKKKSVRVQIIWKE